MNRTNVKLEAVIPEPAPVTFNITGLSRRELDTVLICLKAGSGGIVPIVYADKDQPIYVAGELYNRLSAQYAKDAAK